MFSVNLSAGHRHVVDFLLENFPELEFTECVCNTFPDIIQDTVVNFFKELPSSSKDEDSLFPVSKYNFFTISMS